jgi:hypothetical protein
MPLADDLAALAGNTVVAAAATDAWDTVRSGVGRLFGRAGAEQAELAGRRLVETRRQLAALTGAQLEQAQAVLAQRWAARLTDLLEEHPLAGIPAGGRPASGSGAAAAARYGEAGRLLEP